MTNRKNIFLFLLLTLFWVNNSYASSRDKILIVTSYSSDFKWSKTIIDAIKESVNKRYDDIDFDVEYISSEKFNDGLLWKNRLELFINNYDINRLPKAVVIISDEAWMAYRAIENNKLRDVPLFLCAVKNHSIDVDRYFNNFMQLQLSDFTSTLDEMKNYSATGVLRSPNIDGNVKLMLKLIPEIDNFVFVSDNRFYGIYNRLLFEEYMQREFPDTPVRCVDARFSSSDDLLSVMKSLKSNTGLLLTSWQTKDDNLEFSKQHIYSKMKSIAKTPIFVMNDIAHSQDNFIGGYFINPEIWGQKVAVMISDVLSGKDINSIPPVSIIEQECNINDDLLKSYNITKTNLPDNVVYKNAPQNFTERNRPQMPYIIVLILLVVIGYICMVIYQRKLRIAKESVENAMRETRNANMRLKKSKDELKIALQKAETSNVVKSAFLANIGNHLRTPLNAIIGFADLVVTMESEEERNEAAMQIKNNSDELMMLIMSILDLSELEAGTCQFNYDNLSLHSLFNDTLGLTKSRCSADVEVNVCIPEQNTIIFTENHRVSQVLSILIDNAIKYTNKGVISFGYKFIEEENSIEIFVEDSGIGISEDKIEYIFDRFYKVEQYSAGAGMGLTVAKRIITLLGGDIGASSKLGYGSRFWFKIKADIIN